jgi:hypothetical protein
MGKITNVVSDQLLASGDREKYKQKQRDGHCVGNNGLLLFSRWQLAGYFCFGGGLFKGTPPALTCFGLYITNCP